MILTFIDDPLWRSSIVDIFSVYQGHETNFNQHFDITLGSIATKQTTSLVPGYWTIKIKAIGYEDVIVNVTVVAPS